MSEPVSRKDFQRLLRRVCALEGKHVPPAEIRFFNEFEDTALPPRTGACFAISEDGSVWLECEMRDRSAMLQPSSIKAFTRFTPEQMDELCAWWEEERR